MFKHQYNYDIIHIRDRLWRFLESAIMQSILDRAHEWSLGLHTERKWRHCDEILVTAAPEVFILTATSTASNTNIVILLFLFRCTRFPNLISLVTSVFLNALSALASLYPDIKIHGTNMGPTWVLSAPDGPHVGPMNLAISVPTICVVRNW